jgi:hypothetical protein
MSFVPDSTCPPSGDPVLDSRAVREQLIRDLAAGNPDALPERMVTKELGGALWKVDGVVVTQRVPNLATKCLWLPTAHTNVLANPPAPGATFKAYYHTHSTRTGNNTYGCLPPYSQRPGDGRQVPKAANQSNGGGSPADWQFSTDRTAPVYVINAEDEVYRLDPFTAAADQPVNLNAWKVDRATSCFKHSLSPL